MKVIGIDLAGSEKQDTGFCFMNKNLNTKTEIFHTDKEIIQGVEKIKPDIISIDAPLALPKGRKSLSDRKSPHLRKCDRELLRMKIKFFPITLGPMRKLTARGMKLRKVFEKRGYKVIESFPGSIQDILRIPRKQKGIERLRKGLIKFGFKGDVNKKDATGDELDAVTSALVGKLFLENNYLAIGDPEEVLMILPRKKNRI